MFTKIFKTFLCLVFVDSLFADTTLIKNATIYDGVKNIPFEGNILIENETIKRISSANMQADFVIDASGMIVTPGIIGTDTNIGIVEIGALSVTRDDSFEIYSIGFSIHDAFNPKSTLIPWNRSNGITSALSLPPGHL
jgi:Imidazolonepropionase and related amidohydrolases